MAEEVRSDAALQPYLLPRASLLACVVVPTMIALLYFALISVDRYQTEAKFVVRTPLSSAATQLGGLMQGSKFVRSSDEAYIVHAYLQSHVAVRELAQSMPLLDILSKSDFDIFWRYPPLLWAPSAQRLHRHFQRFINVQFDQSTGISTLHVQAFDPKDAADIASTLLTNAERLVNRLNTRMLEDAVRNSSSEMASALARAVKSHGELTDFRVRTETIDPLRISKSMQQNIGELSLDAAKLRAQISELRKSSPSSAQIQPLLLRERAIEEQIRDQQHRMAGGLASLAPKVAEYERLSVFREFAERSLGSAMLEMEVARTDAIRQKLYLEQVASPAVADHPKYPYRIAYIIAVALLGLAVHSVIISLFGKRRQK